MAEPEVPDDRVAVITGASSGIGAATAALLASRGWRVVLAARRGPALADLVADIEDAGGHAAACVTDVTRAEDLTELIGFAQERFDRVDALVACAGVATVAPLAEGSTADWDAMIDINLRGVLHGISAALPVFHAQGDGHFVTVTSTSAIKWVPGQGVYAASKAGVRAVLEVLRQEVGPAIRVTNVCPGATATEFITGRPDEQASAEERSRREGYLKIAMAPEAVAEAIAYALDQPAGVNVGEIVVRSASQP